MRTTEYTKNPIILAYASVRYNIGLKIRHFMEEHDLTTGRWIPLFYWAVSCESRYNCLIEPELGRRVKVQSRGEWRLYIMQYGVNGKYIGTHYTVPFFAFLFNRVPLFHNWIRRQAKLEYWNSEDREFDRKFAKEHPEYGSFEDRKAEATKRRNYWRETKKRRTA